MKRDGPVSEGSAVSEGPVSEGSFSTRSRRLRLQLAVGETPPSVRTHLLAAAARADGRARVLLLLRRCLRFSVGGSLGRSALAPHSAARRAPVGRLCIERGALGGVERAAASLAWARHDGLAATIGPCWERARGMRASSTPSGAFTRGGAQRTPPPSGRGRRSPSTLRSRGSPRRPSPRRRSSRGASAGAVGGAASAAISGGFRGGGLTTTGSRRPRWRAPTPRRADAWAMPKKYASPNRAETSVSSSTRPDLLDDEASVGGHGERRPSIGPHASASNARASGATTQTRVLNSASGRARLRARASCCRRAHQDDGSAAIGSSGDDPRPDEVTSCSNAQATEAPPRP